MPAEPRLSRDSGGELWFRRPDAAIGDLATRQHGVVTRAQLADCGLRDDAIDYRIRSGRLHRLHRGVYAVGHRRLAREARWLAAVLAVGDEAVLSHRSAAALWRIAPADMTVIDVTAASWTAARPGIDVHQAALSARERTARAGIPVTTAARTVLDLAAVVPPGAVARVLGEAEALRLTRAGDIAALLSRHPGRRGVRALRAVLAASGPSAEGTRSVLERRFLRLTAAAGLPRPDVNALVEVRSGRLVEADMVWHEQRVIVELDGRTWHGTAAAFERDRARDRELQAAGWRVIRITWRQFADHAAAVLADLRALLATPAPGGTAPQPPQRE